jgi:hypothetical protein
MVSMVAAASRALRRVGRVASRNNSFNRFFGYDPSKVGVAILMCLFVYMVLSLTFFPGMNDGTSVERFPKQHQQYQLLRAD